MLLVQVKPLCLTGVITFLIGIGMPELASASILKNDVRLFSTQQTTNNNGTLFGINLISKDWTNYIWTVTLLVVFWGIVLIKFLIGWIIWWWFYYGKNGGLYGSYGKKPHQSNGYASAPYSKIGTKYPYIPATTSKLFNFILNSIDTLNGQFG